jgi:CelD/BcsL family acetyltransferase involved in cellulose biosynthesis
MVDAAQIFEAEHPKSEAGSWAGTVRPFDAARTDYATFCKGKLHSTPQNPAFVEAWAECPGADLVAIELTQGGTIQFMLVVEIVKDGAATIARYPGGRHANGSFPAFTASDLSGIRDLLRQPLAKGRPDVDLLLLERNEAERGAVANPLNGEGCTQSPNVALAVDLDGGFDEVLGRTSGKRKRKKHRSQTRKFETAGGHRRFVATTPDEVDLLLGTFYEMKAARFRQMGVTDVFAPPTIRDAFRRMFVGALGKSQPDFLLHGLEVGGVLRAVTGSSISGDRLTCEFSAFADDELAIASPGDFLFFENIREACESGMAIYDFGVGDERYKRQWCDIESRHFDFHLPLTARGHAVSAVGRMTGAVKRNIKENQTVWSLLKRARRQSAGNSDDTSD